MVCLGLRCRGSGVERVLDYYVLVQAAQLRLGIRINQEGLNNA